MPKGLLFLKVNCSIAAVLLLAFGVGACGIPHRPTVVTISKAPPFRPSSPTDIHSVEEAFAAIITVYRNDLGLPVVEPLSLHLYRNTTSFALYGQGWRTLSLDVENLIAFTDGNTIHINLEKLGDYSWGDLVLVLAHEYAHVFEKSLPDPSHQVKLWFYEGFADWVGFKVVHFLGWRDYQISLHATKRELIRYRNLLPNLSSLTNNQGWKVFSQKPKGWIMTYGLAFMAVDQVIRENGLSAALEYLRTGNFNNNFRSTEHDYYADITRSLEVTNYENSQPFAINRPRWQLGDQWMYENKENGKSKRVIMRVLREDVQQGIPGFVVADDDAESFYSKEDLAVITTTKNGRLATIRNPPNRIFPWPLRPNKESRTKFTLEDFESQHTTLIDRVAAVSGVEDIKVRAGTFRTIKIEKYDSETGRLQTEC